ncbi:MAG: hypothetical protein FWB76_07610 [Oscillospiraceae bacterium]|nr:hypothetical protein [Oscillospiraceae bacterium]
MANLNWIKNRSFSWIIGLKIAAWVAFAGASIYGIIQGVLIGSLVRGIGGSFLPGVVSGLVVALSVAVIAAVGLAAANVFLNFMQDTAETKAIMLAQTKARATT